MPRRTACWRQASRWKGGLCRSRPLTLSFRFPARQPDRKGDSSDSPRTGPFLPVVAPRPSPALLSCAGTALCVIRPPSFIVTRRLPSLVTRRRLPARTPCLGRPPGAGGRPASCGPSRSPHTPTRQPAVSFFCAPTSPFVTRRHAPFSSSAGQDRRIQREAVGDPGPGVLPPRGSSKRQRKPTCAGGVPRGSWIRRLKRRMTIQ